MSTRVVYAGTFDPFTIGHLSIVDKVAQLFDEVIILFADNEAKNRRFDKDKMIEAVQETLREYGLSDHVIVRHYDGLTASFCRQNGAVALIRGLEI